MAAKTRGKGAGRGRRAPARGGLKRLLLWGGFFPIAALLVLAVAIPRCIPMRWVQLSLPQAMPLYGVHYRQPGGVVAGRIVAGARAQIGTTYNASYRVIAYPGGDVARSQGACTDVVVRALRAAGYDLQRLVHEDMVRHREAYPNLWGAGKIDPNIDHRRVPNLMAFFRRHGQTLTRAVNSHTLTEWQPGDIVCWSVRGEKWHIGVVSNGLDANAIPLVIHNGRICVEDNCLTRWPIIGHFRYPR